MMNMDANWFLAEESKNAIFVVADNSEDRLSCFNQIGINPRILQSNFQAKILSDANLSPYALVKAVADQKAQDVAAQLMENKEKYDMVVGFHTVATMDNKIIKKPLNRNEALTILKQLNNRSHSIITGVTLLHSSQKYKTFAVETQVKFGEILEKMFKEYIKSEEWIGQNAAYNIRQKGGAFIESYDGCFFNVLGVPIFEVAKQVRKLMCDVEKSKSPPAAAVDVVIKQESDGAAYSKAPILGLTLNKNSNVIVPVVPPVSTQFIAAKRVEEQTKAEKQQRYQNQQQQRYFPVRKFCPPPVTVIAAKTNTEDGRVDPFRPKSTDVFVFDGDESKLMPGMHVKIANDDIYVLPTLDIHGFDAATTHRLRINAGRKYRKKVRKIVALDARIRATFAKIHGNNE